MYFERIQLSDLTDDEFTTNEGVFTPTRVSAEYDSELEQVKVISNSENNPDSSIYPGGRLKNKIPFGLERGEKYTFIVELNIIEKLHGKLDKEMLKMSVIPIIEENPQWNYAKSNQAANIEGKQYLVSEITIPSEATSIWIRLNAGMTSNGGKVAWKNLGFLHGSVPVHKYLTSNIYTGLLEINERTLNVNEDKAFEYAITVLEFSDIKEMFKIDDHLLLDLNKVQHIKEFLSQWSEDAISINEIPDALKKLLNKVGIDYSWFLKIHSKNVLQRMKTLIWLKNNLHNIKSVFSQEVAEKNKDNNEIPVFVYWADGFNNAPEIVQAIQRILKREIKESKLILLNKNNIGFYIDLPENMDKLFSNSIPHATDYYRVALLKKYGGIWIDSTVVPGTNFEHKIYDMLEKKNNVVTPRYEENVENSTSISNWFIAVSQPGNELISMVEIAIRLWVRDNPKFSYYFMFHSIWDFLIQLDDDLRYIWNNSSFLSAYETHAAQRSMYDPMSDELLNILENNIVNKLTYKYDRKLNKSDTLISFIGRYI